MTKIIWIVVITAIASTFLITSIASTSLPVEAAFQRIIGQPETIPPAGDTIDDIQIRVMFRFFDGVETVNSFRIFDQIEGYDYSKNPLIKLTGVVGLDKTRLYSVTDNSYRYQHSVSMSQYTDFDIDVFLMKGSDVYRMFEYKSCLVLNYNIITLNDAESTFSGDSKFTITDQFLFECQSYELYCPMCSPETQNQSKIENDTEPTIKETWEKYFN